MGAFRSFHGLFVASWWERGGEGKSNRVQISTFLDVIVSRFPHETQNFQSCLRMRGRVLDSPAAEHTCCVLPTRSCVPVHDRRRAATAARERSHADRVIRRKSPGAGSVPVDEVDLEGNPLNVADAGGTLSVLAGFQSAQIKVYQDEKGRGVHGTLFFFGFRLKLYQVALSVFLSSGLTKIKVCKESHHDSWVVRRPPSTTQRPLNLSCRLPPSHMDPLLVGAFPLSPPPPIKVAHVPNKETKKGM
ncbi:hypothetical protein B0T18DRAFT_169999 [Schizothecium vesticola]|uniref:Uncharacterized protein n=1 Tax=Schizothecium vesticola TaxID=314040 RepID=A0AA40ENW2_9PEZI|nr:hypothetical protein B0T18DRAFT_169999 [Schizothecium vesticola]